MPLARFAPHPFPYPSHIFSVEAGIRNGELESDLRLAREAQSKAEAALAESEERASRGEGAGSRRAPAWAAA